MTTTETTTWWQRAHAGGHTKIAYFSMEFALSEELPIYSGGLGVLAGDHLKAAAELGVPLVGVGLLYRRGYFRQSIDEAGRQAETYEPIDPEAVGLVREPVTVTVELDGETISANVWRKDVGSVPLYLLEADLLTDALYSGDRTHRVRQELLLGVGGVRALAALGVEPNVFHMNEGHSAFLAVERIRALVEHGLSLDDAIAQVKRSTVFTTHTPVPAGNEVFDTELITHYVAPLAARAGLGEEQLLALGAYGDAGSLRPDADVAAALGARERRLGAARRGRARDVVVARRRRHRDRARHERRAPRHVARPCARRAAARRRHRPRGAARRDAVGQRTRARRRGALGACTPPPSTRLAGLTHLDPERLTIGFARRFATYKRAGLVFSELERLLALPVQIVVAGKAHPQDNPGKDVMQQIVGVAREHPDRIVFLANYDIALAQTIIPGCDIWLNNPTRPLEASGTSGMKAAVNGVLNLSVLDGWWPEGYAPEVGWAIDGVSDDADREQLYRLLETEVVPTWHQREEWLRMMKTSIATLAPQFSMQRAVIEYVERYYLPAA